MKKIQTRKHKMSAYGADEPYSFGRKKRNYQLLDNSSSSSSSYSRSRLYNFLYWVVVLVGLPAAIIALVMASVSIHRLNNGFQVPFLKINNGHLDLSTATTRESGFNARKYHVGVKAFFLRDSDRTFDRLGFAFGFADTPADTGVRTLHGQVHYPTTNIAGRQKSKYSDYVFGNTNANSALEARIFDTVSSPTYKAGLTQTEFDNNKAHILERGRNSFKDAPVASGKHPVIITQPGNAGYGMQHEIMCEELAAQGYICISMTPNGESSAVNPVGLDPLFASNNPAFVNHPRLNPLTGDYSAPAPYLVLALILTDMPDVTNLQLTSEFFKQRDDDVRTIIKLLDQLDGKGAFPSISTGSVDQANGALDFLRGHVDSDRIGFVGQSVGGDAGSYMSINNDRISGFSLHQSFIPITLPENAFHYDYTRFALSNNQTIPAGIYEAFTATDKRSKKPLHVVNVHYDGTVDFIASLFPAYKDGNGVLLDPPFLVSNDKISFVNPFPERRSATVSCTEDAYQVYVKHATHELFDHRFARARFNLLRTGSFGPVAPKYQGEHLVTQWPALVANDQKAVFYGISRIARFMDYYVAKTLPETQKRLIWQDNDEVGWNVFERKARAQFVFE